MAGSTLISVFLLLCITSVLNATQTCRTVRRCYPMRVCTGSYPNLNCRVRQNCVSQRVCTGGGVWVKRSVSSEQEQQLRNDDLSLATYAFFNLDLNDDGSVDLTDWTQQHGSETDFFVADLNDDGQISREELGEIPIKSIPGEYIREIFMETEREEYIE